MKNKNNEISVSEFKKYCLHLMGEVKDKNISLTITKRKNPVARVMPVPSETKKKSLFGCMKGMITIKGDIVNFTSESEWDTNND